MGDSENIIEYTPEELAEIDRIVGVISRDISASYAASAVVPPVPKKIKRPELGDGDLDGLDDEFIGEPEDLDLPSGDLERAVSGEDEEEPAYDEEPEEDLEGITPAPEIDEAFDIDEMPVEEQGGFDDDEFSLKETDLEEIPAEEIQDITDLIELDEVPAAAPEEIEDLPAEPVPVMKKEKVPAGTPLDQLNALTSDEPESLDASDITHDDFMDEDLEEAPVQAKETADDIDFELPEEPSKAAGPGEVSLGKESDADIPDLSDLSFEETGELPEAAYDDIPDIDIGDIGSEAGAKEEETTIDMDAGMHDFSDGDVVDIGHLEDEAVGKTTRLEDVEKSAIADVGISEEDLVEIDKIDIGDIKNGKGKKYTDEGPGGDFIVEPLDEAVTAAPRRARAVSAEEDKDTLDLSSREIKKLKKAIILFNPAIIKEIKNIILNDLLQPGDTRQLVDLILTGKSEDTVQRFIEKKLNKTIVLEREGPAPGRKVLYSRSEYTREGRDRQKRLLKITKIFAAAAVITCILSLLGYNYIYKPRMAKKLIQEGVGFIHKKGDYQAKLENFRKAEGIFKDVNLNYMENYLSGYNAYGRAYFDIKEYNYSLIKLNRAYELDPRNAETLNSLGYFYSRVPDPFYQTVRTDLNKWYYEGKKKSAVDKPQLDIAIDFYKRVLFRNREDVTALHGIGNAYYHQGQYLTAKKYYEDILKIDPESILGYSGLMNLYIERDSFPLVATLHAEIRGKDLMPELPSALLGKLIEYYMSKRKTETSNIRIDYGVQSKRLKNDSDNIDPAVQAVLRDLNTRDPEYPPLLVHSARFSRAQGNLKVMEKYLEKAIDLTPNYFGALHLLGEYYFLVNEPVKAYEYLNRSINAFSNQPDFTMEEFYTETENIGKSYAILGDIFYYYFDRIRYRYGDLEDEVVEDNQDRLVNYNIARKRYEEALQNGFESPELHYNLGRIYYLDKLYRDALDQWLFLYEDFVSRPELMFALGNAFYHLGNYDAAKGEYLKLVDVFENEAESIRLIDKGNSGHVKIFRTISSAYNNLGAVYQIQNNESKSGISYWKSIDYAKRLDVENEFARVNLARSFNRKNISEPILDEDLPYSIEYYREEMRRPSGEE